MRGYGRIKGPKFGLGRGERPFGHALARAPRESGRYPADILHVLGTVRAEYLESALDLIEREYGG